MFHLRGLELREQSPAIPAGPQSIIPAAAIPSFHIAAALLFTWAMNFLRETDETSATLGLIRYRVRTNQPLKIRYLVLANAQETLKRLAESEEKYRRLFELSEDPMWLILNNKFEICNEAAVTCLGYASQEELASTHPSALSPPMQPDGIDSFTKAEQMMAAAMEKGYHRFEWAHRRKNGEDFPVEVTLTAIPYEGGHGIYCVWRDISDRKQAEEELKEAKLVADEANLAKSRFLALMSHELRTPLNAVIGFSDMLKMHLLGPLNDKQLDAVDSINKGGTLLLNLVSDLLDFAKLESGEFDMCIEGIDPIEALATAVSFVADEARNRKITIHWDQEANQLSGTRVVADKLRLIQSIVNLLSNAIKYTAEGGNIWLSVAEDTAKGTCTIGVKDDGCGIAEDQFDAIFEAFNRGAQQGSHIEGTGLGLNVAKRLLTAMGGDIHLESAPGIGTTFYLKLLRSAVQEEAKAI